MSGRIKQRTAANSADLATSSVNEKILKECHTLYVHPDKGLIPIAASVGLNLLPPRKKISVLLIGNHSAGKSSFINWYIEEHVQKTGVAIETQGFTLVTSGKKRESLTGNATLHLYPQFKEIQEMKGLVDFLSTEISTSKQKKFGLVTFIDTPGLVDGDMSYPYDVDGSVLWFAGLADLVLVFFDPIGQALCKRTLNLVEKINIRFPERIKFYLSKADEAGHESDRQKVMMQIVQELCKRPGLNKCGFDMPTVYIPDPNRPSRCTNQIDEICMTIEKTINQTIQNTLNGLERDCQNIVARICQKEEDDNYARRSNLHSNWQGLLYAFTGFLLIALLLVNSLLSRLPTEILNSFLGQRLAETVELLLFPIRQFWRLVPDSYHMHGLFILLFIAAICFLLAKIYIRTKQTLSRKEKRLLLERKAYIQDFVKNKKQQLYSDYLKQSVADYDL